MANYLIKTHESIILDDKVIDFLLVRSKKRKYSLSMRISRDGKLQINVPSKTQLIDVNDFINTKKSWVLEKLLQYRDKNHKQLLSYVEGEKHYFQGNLYHLKLVVSTFSRVELRQDDLIVYYRRSASIKNVLDKWYQQQALDYFTQRSKYFVQLHGLPKIKEIKIRRMKARWGSCSSHRVITYNTHLIKTPIDCIDYVILHELCHLIHQNHQKGFHQLQLKLNPLWKQQKQKLDSFAQFL